MMLGGWGSVGIAARNCRGDNRVDGLGVRLAGHKRLVALIKTELGIVGRGVFFAFHIHVIGVCSACWELPSMQRVFSK
jgi:hypothetical protein